MRSLALIQILCWPQEKQFGRYIKSIRFQDTIIVDENEHTFGGYNSIMFHIKSIARILKNQKRFFTRCIGFNVIFN